MGKRQKHTSMAERKARRNPGKVKQAVKKAKKMTLSATDSEDVIHEMLIAEAGSSECAQITPA